MTLHWFLKAGLALTWALMLLVAGIAVAALAYDWRPNPFLLIIPMFVLGVIRQLLASKLKQIKSTVDNEQAK